MTDDRLGRILALLESESSAAGGGTRGLCAVAASVTAATGAGIMLGASELPYGSLCTTDAVSELIENLQFTLGEGPCIDAHRDGVAVIEPDLGAPARSRWPAFAPAAIEAGARAVFGFPLRVGMVRLGALNLYRDRTGSLSDDEHTDALVMADVAARAILAMQAAAASGEIAPALDAEANFNRVVHQASGMVSIQLDVTVGEAMVRLRSYAFLSGRLLGDLAADVVARRLRLDE